MTNYTVHDFIDMANEIEEKRKEFAALLAEACGMVESVYSPSSPVFRSLALKASTLEEQADSFAKDLVRIAKVDGYRFDELQKEKTTAPDTNTRSAQGFLVVGRHVLDQQWFQTYTAEIKLHGMPRCSVCGEPLTMGSWVDSQWPYSNANCQHIGCAKETP